MYEGKGINRRGGMWTKGGVLVVVFKWYMEGGCGCTFVGWAELITMQIDILVDLRYLGNEKVYSSVLP